MLHSICQHSVCQSNLEKSAVAQNWKRSVFIPIPKKGNAKECSNYCTIALISHASKVILKNLQVRLQQYMNHEPPDVQAGFRKGRRTRDQIANIHCIMEKALHHVTLDKLCFSGHCLRGSLCYTGGLFFFILLGGARRSKLPCSDQRRSRLRRPLTLPRRSPGALSWPEASATLY